MEQKIIETPHEFADICPIEDKDVNQKLNQLIEDPGFRFFIEFIMPGVDYEKYCE